MLAFCPKCKAKVSVVMVLANDVARRDLAENKPIQVIHVTSTREDHVWAVAKEDLTEEQPSPG